MKKPFSFKEGDTNLEKLYKYALYHFPKSKKDITLDEWGQFVSFKKSEHVYYFYAVMGLDLYVKIYHDNIKIKDVLLAPNFKQKVYSDEQLSALYEDFFSTK